jgi:OmpA-OmpF porin, OOP family
MSNNLLELLKEHLSGDVVSNIAALIGESPKNTETALHTALPSLLAGLVEKSSDANNIGSLFDILVKGTHDGGILSNLGALSRGGDETSKLVSEGGSLLASLFGDKVSGIADLVANASGISKNSSSSLLNFVTPVVLGLIGKHLKIGHAENATGLAGLLGDQSGFLKDLIPAGLSNLLSGNTASVAAAATNPQDTADQISSYISEKTASVTETLVNIEDTIEDTAEETLASAKHIAEEFSESATQFSSHVVEESKEFVHSAANAIEESTEGGSKILPWLLIAAALALAWGLLKSCAAPDTSSTATAPPVTAPAVTAPPVTSPPPAEPVVAAPPTPSTPEPTKVEAPATDSNAFEKTLSSGYAIKSAKDGFVSKLMGYIEGNEPINKDLWFTMDGITFDTNKATIKAESALQINDIAEILKAFPKVKIKIGGYTDNTGKANANKKLSDNRANAVKKALVSKDIKGDRIDAEGYGSDHPVASNDTEEGRQQNRRIDVRVTEK